MVPNESVNSHHAQREPISSDKNLQIGHNLEASEKN